jgi:3-deoxy-D-manno-octulosonic-acid transferase
MMRFFYNVAIRLLGVVYFLASFFHPKAKQFVEGRKNIFLQLRKAFHTRATSLVWIHCASLGEFEQGRPVIEALKNEFPATKILLTFFSPSGFEVRKTYPGADYIFYLPLDTPSHARQFVEIVQPTLAIFVKYEFWFNYTEELSKRNVPMVSVSCIFRDDQIYFKTWGSLFRQILGHFTHFFVQNRESVNLLQSIGVTCITLSGDTRFDRVFEITQHAEEIPLVKKFKGGEKVLVIGSCWPEDMELLAPFINEYQDRLKFIVAPHEINEGFLTSIEQSIQAKSIRFSNPGTAPEDAQVLLIDNMGMLSQLYRYGEFAWIGGGFGKGIHNVLEAACYGVPIFFGNKNYDHFKEAKDLILRGGAFEIGNFTDLKVTYEMLQSSPENFLLACEVTRQYVFENLGATEKIMKYISPFLKK